jgi:hypothetical protein
MDLYHADIRLPAGFRLPNRLVKLAWSNHALRARRDDRYGDIPQIPLLNLGECRAVEVGMEGQRVAKIVVRAELDDDNDVVFVLIPRNPAYLVKTVWINRRDDKHKTLDRSKYMR